MENSGKSSSILIGAGAIVGIAYLITKAKAQPTTCNADNNIKIHVEEYDKSDIYSDVYDIHILSADTDIKITDVSRNLLHSLQTNDTGDTCLIYDNRYIPNKWYIATASKYGYMSIDFSSMQEFKIPIKEINLTLYKIYEDLDIIIGD